MAMVITDTDRSRKQFFNDRAEHWHEIWDHDPNAEQRARHVRAFERLFSLLPLQKGDHILDAGCGSGVLVPFICERIGETGVLYELDYAERMIAANRSRHQGDNVRFIVSEAEQATLEEGTCDGVVCFCSFPHFRDKAKALRTFARILKPGGLFAVAHFKSSAEINSHHASHQAVMNDRLPDESTMRALLKAVGLGVEQFIDEPGFYCVITHKQ